MPTVIITPHSRRRNPFSMTKQDNFRRPGLATAPVLDLMLDVHSRKPLDSK